MKLIIVGHPSRKTLHTIAKAIVALAATPIAIVQTSPPCEVLAANKSPANTSNTDRLMASALHLTKDAPVFIPPPWQEVLAPIIPWLPTPSTPRPRLVIWDYG